MCHQDKINLYLSYLAKADRYYNIKNIKKAEDVLNSVKKNHPEYIFSQNILGKIHFKDHRNYKKAETIFKSASKYAKENSLPNRIFHILKFNHTLSIIRQGDTNLEKNKIKSALSYYKKSADLFSDLLKSFNPKEEFILKNYVLFYKALSFTKIWQQNKESEAKKRAHEKWLEFEKNYKKSFFDNLELISYANNELQKFVR